jgi:hypothetical protein
MTMQSTQFPKLSALTGTIQLQDINDRELAREIQTLLVKGGFLRPGKLTFEQTKQAFEEFKKKFYLASPNLLGESTVPILLDLDDEVDEDSPRNQPQDPVVKPETKISEPDRGRPITIPKRGVVYLGEPILGSGGHFSWAEATKNGTRIPVSADIVDGILKVAEAMEKVREYMDQRPITINSWYRDPVSNRKAGGATRSRHLSGDAVDFVVQGIHPKETHRRLEPWWGSRGGIASASCFTHLDCRGHAARWSYGF